MLSVLGVVAVLALRPMLNGLEGVVFALFMMLKEPGVAELVKRLGVACVLDAGVKAAVLKKLPVVEAGAAAPSVKPALLEAAGN